MAPAKPDCAAPGVRGRTEAPPPFLPLVRQTGQGGVTHPSPPFGVASVLSNMDVSD